MYFHYFSKLTHALSFGVYSFSEDPIFCANIFFRFLMLPNPIHLTSFC